MRRLLSDPEEKLLGLTAAVTLLLLLRRLLYIALYPALCPSVLIS